MCFLSCGLSCKSVSPVSYKWLFSVPWAAQRPAALSPAVIRRLGFAGDPLFPALADQAHSASGIVGDSLQEGETEEFCRRHKGEFDPGLEKRPCVSL